MTETNTGMAGGHTMPLDGFRVLDCTQWNSGPLATRLLGDLGADVIKVESIQHPDPARLAAARFAGAEGGLPESYWERSPEWNYVNRNKQGITLDLTREQGVSAFLALTRQADIVVENLRPGVWEGFGLGYDQLKAVNPSLIFVEMPGYGTVGPYAAHPCWAVGVDQMSGFTSFTGYEGEGPLSHALWADYANGMHLGLALMAALWHRRRTGQGQFVDLSQLEVATFMNGESLLDWQLNGRDWRPGGNASRQGFAPHGVFPAADGGWIAISVEDDQQWQALGTVAVGEGWAADARFGDAAGRQAGRAELHGLVSSWTQLQDKNELAHALQRAGVPAAGVAYAGDVHQDPHYQGRGALESVDRAVVGRQTFVGAPFRYSKTPVVTRRPAPTLGEHNERVLKDLAGLTEEEIRAMEAAGVVGTRPLH